jgi:hypothetical protein
MQFPYDFMGKLQWTGLTSATMVPLRFSKVS